jgi:hypothetical protein
MIGIGMGISLFAYALGLWGYCGVKRYNVSFKKMFSSTPPLWPPAKMDPNLVFGNDQVANQTPGTPAAGGQSGFTPGQGGVGGGAGGGGGSSF